MSSDKTPARGDDAAATATSAERRARSFDNVAARYGLDLAKRGHLDGFGACACACSARCARCARRAA